MDGGAAHDERTSCIPPGRADPGRRQFRRTGLFNPLRAIPVTARIPFLDILRGERRSGTDCARALDVNGEDTLANGS